MGVIRHLSYFHLGSYSKTKDVESSCNEESFNSRARSLLDAIEVKRAFCLDREIRDALVEFLQSEVTPVFLF